ncbi:MAG: hypothetical protein GEV09_09705 [Pseudonocardiaceae bacterium]|nr:hypothetical protein [Pseudonocardiaceae bacterium]
MSDPLRLATTADPQPHDPADPPGALRVALLAGQGLPPAYGTDAWVALPDDHPGKWVAVLLAAECWRRYWTPDMRALRADAAERALRVRLRAMCRDLADGRDWRQHATAPSYAELERRRATPPEIVTVACVEPGCPATYSRPAHLHRPGTPTPRCWHHTDTAGREVA